MSVGTEAIGRVLVAGNVGVAVRESGSEKPVFWNRGRGAAELSRSRLRPLRSFLPLPVCCLSVTDGAGRSWRWI